MLAAGLVVVAGMTINGRFNDPDLWFHLRLGKIVWDTHAIPSTDIFSFTAYGHPWTAHEWLAELTIYAAYRAGGFTGLMVWFYATASLLFGLVYALCYRACGNALGAFLGGLCAWYFATVGLAIRPHLLGYVLLAAEFLLLEAATRNRRSLYALPPLFAVWVNCHGSYIFGLGVLGAYWVCSFLNVRWGAVVSEGADREARTRLTWALALSVVALCLNPIGVRLLLYPFNAAFQQSTGLSAVEEWRAPDLRSGRAVCWLVASVGILLVPLIRRMEVRLRDLLLVAMAFALAAQHVRMLFVFGIVASPVICRLLAPFMGRDRKRDHPVANALLLAVFAAAIIGMFPGAAELRRQVQKGNPVSAVDYIRSAGLSGPMLNEYVFGDYLIWALPEQKVFIDGRGDVYDWTGVFAEYGRWATLSEDPRLMLDRRGIRFCLLSKDSPMTHVLPYLPGWREAYSDDVAAVFVR